MVLLNDAIMSSSSAVTSQAFMVKKIVFEVAAAFVKIGSAVLVNLAFWVFLLIVCLAYGYYPSWWWLQLALLYVVYCN